MPDSSILGLRLSLHDMAGSEEDDFRGRPPITGVVSRDRCNTLDETCLDGCARWDGCLVLSGTSCGICGRLVSHSG
jgi:hypothetical protein